MVDLFKKKTNNKTSVPAKPKKPLFGKKGSQAVLSADDVDFDLPEQTFSQEELGMPKAAKKPMFSLGKNSKTTKEKPTKSAAKPSLFSNKKTNTSSKVSKEKPQMDKQRLLMLLGGLLSLVLLALAAKMFFLSEPELSEPTPTVAAAPTTPQTEVAPPTEVAPESAPMPTEAISEQTVVAEQSTAPIVSDAPPVVSEATPTTTVNEPPVTPTTNEVPEVNAVSADSAPVPSGKVSYEEFIKQSETRVYRERSTSPTGQ